MRKIIAVVGILGSNKNAISECLRKKLDGPESSNTTLVDFGSKLWEKVKSGALSPRCLHAVENHDLVPNHIANAVFSETVRNVPSQESIVIAGFPMNTAQYEFMVSIGLKPSTIIFLHGSSYEHRSRVPDLSREEFDAAFQKANKDLTALEQSLINASRRVSRTQDVLHINANSTAESISTDIFALIRPQTFTIASRNYREMLAARRVAAHAEHPGQNSTRVMA